MRTQSPDTDPEVERKLFERYRRLTADQKMEYVGALGRMVCEVALAAIRSQHPEESEREWRLRLASRWIDRERMIRLYGWDPVDKGP